VHANYLYKNLYEHVKRTCWLVGSPACVPKRANGPAFRRARSRGFGWIDRMRS
jgi:hypothetical protein